jgi:hypothetical protein
LRRLDVGGIGFMTVPGPSDHTTAGGSSSRSTALAFLGLLLVLVGVVGYFLVVLRLGHRFPNVRNDPIALWLVVAAGLAVSVFAIGRARVGRRAVPAVVLGLDLVLTAAFAAFLYVLLQVPAAAGPAVGTAAHDFALADQNARTRRLADFRGHPLLLVFYRGHW